MAKIVHRTEEDRAREIDNRVRNKFAWSWMEKPVVSNAKTESRPVEEERKVVPLCDRVSNAEAMVLGVIAEYSMSLSMTPVLIDLVKSLSQDRQALSHLSVDRTSASYKMTYGMGKTFTDETIEIIRQFPFSLNMDESTSNNLKRILTILVSYYNPVEGVVRVEHLKSVEVIGVDPFDVVVDLFEEHDISWSNLISALMDSCSVMRGSKNGLETKFREKASNLVGWLVEWV
ncbi:hypothetical protein ScPMuIL_014294 [Solemya velum]